MASIARYFFFIRLPRWLTGEHTPTTVLRIYLLRAECAHGARASRRDGRDRGLQGLRADPSVRARRPRGDAHSHARRGAVRHGADLRGAGPQEDAAGALSDFVRGGPALDRALSANTLAKLAQGLADNVLTQAA